MPGLENFINILQGLITHYHVWGVFAASLIEEIIAPIPSPAVIMFAAYTLLKGFSLGTGSIKLVLIIALPVAAGITLGSTVFYFIGYYAGKPAIVRYGKWLGLTWNNLQKAEEAFTKGYRDEALLIVVRALPILPNVAINAICGIIRFDFKTFLLTTFVGSFLRGLILGAIGWQLGSVYEKYAHYFENMEKWFTMLIAVSVIGFVLYKIIKKMHERTS